MPKHLALRLPDPHGPGGNGRPGDRNGRGNKEDDEDGWCFLWLDEFQSQCTVLHLRKPLTCHSSDFSSLPFPFPFRRNASCAFELSVMNACAAWTQTGAASLLQGRSNDLVARLESASPAGSSEWDMRNDISHRLS